MLHVRRSRTGWERSERETGGLPQPIQVGDVQHAQHRHSPPPRPRCQVGHNHQHVVRCKHILLVPAVVGLAAASELAASLLRKPMLLDTRLVERRT
jgi:hypothetical protein